MKQQDLGLNLSKRRTRKAVFLDEMNLVVPWSIMRGFDYVLASCLGEI